MTRLIYLILMIILASCGNLSSDKNNEKVDTLKSNLKTGMHTADTIVNNTDEDTTDSDYATYFVVVADTSQDYYLLDKKMLDLHKNLHIKIDTMGRYYNKTKNLIALPDNDDDEMYAGDYSPRRFPSDNLSLEYLDYYQQQAGEKTIALVTGIYENEKSADSALTILKTAEKKSYKIKANIYIGCIH